MARVTLVVDDDPQVREVVMLMLEGLGCEVVSTSNATAALAMLDADHRIEIMITDINMPGMNGYELAEKARRDHTGLQVIMISGGADREAGVPFIRKPFTEGDLKQVMQATTGLY